MAVISNPQITLSILSSPQALADAPQRVFMIGQVLGTGTAPVGELYQNVLADGSEDVLFGRRTMLADMIRIFRSVNTLTRVDVFPLAEPDSGAAAATATITIAGTPTATGNLTIGIQDSRRFTFTTGVSLTSTGAGVATALASLINANTEILCSAAVSTNVITLTSTHKGLEGNFLGLITLSQIPGLTVTTAAFSGGAGDVELPDFATVLGDVRYQSISYPSVYNMETITQFIDTRFNPTNAILDGVVTSFGSETSQTTAIAKVSTLNSPSFVYFANKIVSASDQKGGAIVAYNPSMAAYFCAIRALRLTPNANIAPYKLNGSTVGGTYMAVIPYGNTPLEQLSVIVKNRGWGSAEQTALNNAAVSFLGNNMAGNRIIIGNVVTTYLTTGAGQADSTFRYLNAVDTISAIREYMVNNCQLAFQQKSLTDGALSGAPSEINVGVIRNYLVGFNATLGNSTYGLVQTGVGGDGVDYTKAFKDNLVVTVDIESGTATVAMVAYIKSQFRGLVGTIIPAFTVTTGV